MIHFVEFVYLRGWRRIDLNGVLRYGGDPYIISLPLNVIFAIDTLDGELLGELSPLGVSLMKTKINNQLILTYFLPLTCSAILIVEAPTCWCPTRGDRLSR